MFYLCNGYKQLNEILNCIWLPMEIQRKKITYNLNSTTTYTIGSQPLDSDRDEIVFSEPDHEQTYSEEIKQEPVRPKKITTKLKSILPPDVVMDWELFEAINLILEYTNVVLNDLEIFQTPEIYSTMLRSYHPNMPAKVEDCLLNVTYKITIDKNHRISNRRYNAMYSKDFIKTFNNIFSLYCAKMTIQDQTTQEKYFNLLMKLIYHNILLVNDKTL